MPETPGSETISTKRQRLAELSRRVTSEAVTNLSHYMDLKWLREAYRRTRKDGAVGSHGQTAEQYAENLEVNPLDLLERAKSGSYRASVNRDFFIHPFLSRRVGALAPWFLFTQR